MSAGPRRIMSPFTGRKKQKPWNNTRENYMPEGRRQNLTKRQGIILQSRGMVDEFLDNKGAFYNGSENDDGDNDDENYNENMEAVVGRCSSK